MEIVLLPPTTPVNSKLPNIYLRVIDLTAQFRMNGILARINAVFAFAMSVCSAITFLTFLCTVTIGKYLINFCGARLAFAHIFIQS